MPRPANASRQTQLLLNVMLEQPLAWRYGYELSKATGLTSGTLYPLLMRLNDQGLMESAWQEGEGPGRPPRHVYRLSAHGIKLARERDVVLAEKRVPRRKDRVLT
jgi:PadR family transcriptional regulator PadR